jgi:hypothetical protein
MACWMCLTRSAGLCYQTGTYVCVLSDLREVMDLGGEFLGLGNLYHGYATLTP